MEVCVRLVGGGGGDGDFRVVGPLVRGAAGAWCICEKGARVGLDTL